LVPNIKELLQLPVATGLVLIGQIQSMENSIREYIQSLETQRIIAETLQGIHSLVSRGAILSLQAVSHCLLSLAM